MRALLFCLLLGACKEPKPPMVKVEFSVYLEGPSLEGVPLRWGSAELGRLDRYGRLERMLTRSEATRDLSGFSLRVATPCGEESIPLRRGVTSLEERFSDEDFDQDWRTPRVSLEEPERRRHGFGVVVDNRDGPATRLVVGALSFPVDSKRVSVLPAWHPTCGAVPIKAGERDLGLLAGAPPDEECGKAAPMALISLSGPRCYLARPMIFELNLFGPGSTPTPPATRLEGRALYMVPRIDYALVEPPRTISSSAGAPSCRRQLLDCSEIR